MSTELKQEDVTDEQINAVALEQWGPHTGGPLAAHRAFARAILALRPERVPMTDDERGEAYMTQSKSYEGYRSTFMRGVWAAEAHHGITAQADLWCIHIPGTDEVHAAPSKEAADHMATKHNAVMATYYASGAPNLEFAPSIENVQAAVVKWPYDQQSHADELREFDWAGWGLTQKGGE